jgi:hypothetical protein
MLDRPATMLSRSVVVLVRVGVGRQLAVGVELEDFEVGVAQQLVDQSSASGNTGEAGVDVVGGAPGVIVGPP